MMKKSYGRQRAGKTIKSVSMDAGLASRLEAEAEQRGVSVSALISDLLSAALDGAQWFYRYIGQAAAGEPVSATDAEMIPLPDEWPDDHFVVEIVGRSMEPTLTDGTRHICEPRTYTPAHDKVCVIADGHGLAVKRYDRKRKAFVSDNPEYPDLTPAGEVKLLGYVVEELL